jgi:hypothetical protein
VTEERALTWEDIQERKRILMTEMAALDRLEVAFLSHGANIKVGDRVRKTLGPTKGCEFIVHQVHYISSANSPSGKPWVSGYQIKKDGTPGLSLKHLYYEWEKIEDVPLSEKPQT